MYRTISIPKHRNITKFKSKINLSPTFNNWPDANFHSIRIFIRKFSYFDLLDIDIIQWDK